MPENAAYCMSKHAVRSLTEALEMELWDSNIACSSVHPGAIATRIAEDGRVVEGGQVDRETSTGTIAKGLPPEAAARIIADGIANKKRRILIGRDAKMLAWLVQLMPVYYRNIVARYFARFFERNRKRAEAAGA